MELRTPIDGLIRFDRISSKTMNIPNWDEAVAVIQQALRTNPGIRLKASKVGSNYQGRRGLMVVDCVASRQRKYKEYVVPKLLPQYEAKAMDLSLKSLASKSPSWLPLRSGEAMTMKKVAKQLLQYGESVGLRDEEEICVTWAADSRATEELVQIKGIGPALLQYLRMLCGADSLKVDIRVIENLAKTGLPVNWFTPDGVLELCKELAKEANCSLIELDQVLWHIEFKGQN